MKYQIKEPLVYGFCSSYLFSWVAKRKLNDIYYFVYRESSLSNEEGKVLEIGSGTGLLAAKIAENSALNVTGLDPSKYMIKISINNVRKHGLQKNIHFKQGYGENIPFTANHFDHVISTFSMHHWVNVKKALIEIQRVLKPGGNAWLFDFDGAAIDHDINRWLKKIKIPVFIGQLGVRSSIVRSKKKADLVQLFKVVGFNHFKIKKSGIFLFSHINNNQMEV